MTTEQIAAIPAMWPAVAMCPVIQKEIAKISAVPISRHVMAFAIALRIGCSPRFSHWPERPVDPHGSCATRLSGVIVFNIEVLLVVIVAEFQRGPWSCAALLGPFISGSTAARLVIIVIDKILSTIESNC
jgi:hypothetical protein